MSRRDCRQKPCLSFISPVGGGYFSMKESSKRILGQIGDRLAAGRRFCRVQGRYTYPAGAYFCSCKSRQNTLGAVPQDPLTLKLRLDTNDVNIVRTAPQIRSQGACGAFYFGPSRNQIKNQPYKRRLAPDPGGRRPSGRGKWGPRKVARPCGERRMHCSGEGCPKQSIGSARLKRRLRPTSVGFLGRSPE